jgi:hypothetical protein
VNALEQQANAKDQQLSQDLSRYQGQSLDQMTGAKDVNVAAFTIGQSGSVSGSGLDSKSMASISNEISMTAKDSVDQQNRIDSRNPVTRFILGGDRQAASALLQDAGAYETQINALQQILSSGTVNPAMKPVLEQEIQVLQKEHDRLTSIATTESQSRGILGFLGPWNIFIFVLHQDPGAPSAMGFKSGLPQIQDDFFIPTIRIMPEHEKKVGVRFMHLHRGG